MFRNALIILLITGHSAFAMNETLRAYCKENRYDNSCSGLRHESREERKLEIVSSGPEWELIEGQTKKDIVGYFVQDTFALDFTNCIRRGSSLVDAIEFETYRITKAWPSKIFNFEDKAVPRYSSDTNKIRVERKRRSTKPLLRISGETTIQAPDNNVVPAGDPTLPQKYYQYEIDITTNSDHKKTESIEYRDYYIRYSKVFVNDKDKPQAIVKNEKVISKEFKCEVKN